MIERWTWWVVKGCVLPFLTQGKGRFFPNRLSPECMGGFRTFVLVWGHAHIDKWKADWGVRHVKLFSLCLSEEVLQDLISCEIKEQVCSAETKLWQLGMSELHRSPLGINSRGAFLRGTDCMYNYRICRRQLLDCAQVLYTITFQSPWLFPVGVLPDILIFFYHHGLQSELGRLKSQIILYVCRH